MSQRPDDMLAWARAERAHRAHDEATLMPSPADLLSGRDPVRRARYFRRVRAGLTRAEVRHWLQQAEMESINA